MERQDTITVPIPDAAMRAAMNLGPYSNAKGMKTITPIVSDIPVRKADVYKTMLKLVVGWVSNLPSRFATNLNSFVPKECNRDGCGGDNEEDNVDDNAIQSGGERSESVATHLMPGMTD